jgi:uncharacterized protein (DUF169 family)
MTDFRLLEQQFTTTLALRRRPVAITMSASVPATVPTFEGTVPSGCTFWKLAAEGRTFFTVPSDHYNCPIGCYTHNIPLPAERTAELTQTLSLMSDIGYIRMEEVPGIPQLPVPPVTVIYAPLGDTPTDPDVVVFSGSAGSIMLLQEAAIRAGVAAQLNTLGRPTCMAVPAAKALGMVASTGCIGNRVYTELNEADLYAIVPGNALETLAAEVATVRSANDALLEYHTARRQQLFHA